MGLPDVENRRFNDDLHSLYIMTDAYYSIIQCCHKSELKTLTYYVFNSVHFFEYNFSTLWHIMNTMPCEGGNHVQIGQYIDAMFCVGRVP